MDSVIFVCTGNMCRSPMAEGIFKAKIKELGREGIACSSMGIHAPQDEKASADSVAVCAQNKIDISNHLTRPLVYEELVSASYVFVMESYQRDFLRTFVPRISDKVFLLGAWPGKEMKESIVSDPIGGKLSDYERTYKLINYHIERTLPFLLAEFS